MKGACVLRILVVDDSLFVRKVITNHLMKTIEGVEIIQCDNGSTAFETYKSENVDFIVTDLLMPVMTGQEFLQEVHGLNEPYKCIVCTADIQEGTKKDLEQFDIIQIIEKPLTAEKLNILVSHIKESCNE